MQIFGGVLFKPIFQLICGIGDVVIATLQKLFLTYKTPISFSVGGINQYIIRYSPGIIFSGTIPAFDINFINPQNSDSLKQYGYRTLTTVYHKNITGEDKPERN